MTEYEKFMQKEDAGEFIPLSELKEYLKILFSLSN